MTTWDERSCSEDETGPKFFRKRTTALRREKERPRRRTPARIGSGVTIDGLHVPHSLTPAWMLERRTTQRSRSMFSTFAHPILVIGVAATIAFLVVTEFRFSSTIELMKEATVLLRPTPQSKPPVLPAKLPSARRLILAARQTASRESGESVPLGISIRDESADASLLVKGLTNGAMLSAGILTNEGWRVTGAELKDAMIKPPAGFAGTMDLLVELRAADGSIDDHTRQRFEWVSGPAGGAELLTPPLVDPAILKPSQASVLHKNGHADFRVPHKRHSLAALAKPNGRRPHATARRSTALAKHPSRHRILGKTRTNEPLLTMPAITTEHWVGDQWRYNISGRNISPNSQSWMP